MIPQSIIDRITPDTEVLEVTQAEMHQMRVDYYSLKMRCDLRPTPPIKSKSITRTDGLFSRTTSELFEHDHSNQQYLQDLENWKQRQNTFSLDTKTQDIIGPYGIVKLEVTDR